MPYRKTNKFSISSYSFRNNAINKIYPQNRNILNNSPNNYYNNYFRKRNRREYSINKNKSDLNEIYSLKRKLEILINKIIKIQNYDPKRRFELKNEVNSIENLTEEIFVKLKDDSSLKNEFFDFIKIKNMTNYILDDELISKNKHVSFVLNLVEEFYNLIKCKIEMNHHRISKEEYCLKYEEFSKFLFKKFRYFNRKIGSCPPELVDKINDFTRNVII